MRELGGICTELQCIVEVGFLCRKVELLCVVIIMGLFWQSYYRRTKKKKGSLSRDGLSHADGLTMAYLTTINRSRWNK